MRDDERPDGHKHPDEAEDQFDDALDDLFGPDEDDEETTPAPSQQRPQPPGGSTPPERSFEPDLEHHEPDQRHVFGPGNMPPPPSYDTFERPPEPTATQTSIPVTTPTKGRDWRRIACFGCLAAVGIPAICLGILIVIGIVAGDDEGEPTEAGVFIDEVRPTATAAATPTTGEQPASIAAVMEGRDPLTITVDGETGFGQLDKPVPLTVRAALGDGWELQVNAVTVNANQSVAEANMFNDPPVEGRQFVIANITATNGTDAANIFDASFRLRLAGAASGNLYTTFDAADRCGVIPDPVSDDEIAPEAAVTGNVCWQIRSEDVDSLVLYSESFSELDAAIWFELTPSLSAR